MDIFRFRRFPEQEKFVLTAQLWRALNSIVLNIAEGSDHYSGIEFGKYLNVALTSLNEVVSCLDCAIDDKYISDKKHSDFLQEAENIAKQLKALSAKVRSQRK